MADYNFPAEDKSESPKVKWYHHVVDFANIFKAFIGTNYLSLAFAFKMSGLGLGLIVGFVICLVTNHCCQLIVRCKNHLIDDICYKYMYRRHQKHDNIGERNLKELRLKLSDNMAFADIGRLAVGRWGGALVNVFIVITQVAWCIQYAVFTGTMIYQIYTSLNQQKNSSQTSGNVSVITPVENVTVITPVEDGEAVPLPVPLQLLVFLPVVVFIPTTLFRNIRQMGAISIIANVCVFTGFLSVTLYIYLAYSSVRGDGGGRGCEVAASTSTIPEYKTLKNFSLSPSFVWVRWSTFPIFIGSVTAAYEAIGVIIPIQSSMKDNQHNFSSCLNGAIVFFTLLVGSLGMLGYLRYGEDVAQILAQNLPADEPIVLVIYITLIIGVLLTYPLQVYPVVQIMEKILFSSGHILGPPSSNVSEKQDIIWLSEECVDSSEEDDSGRSQPESREDQPLISGSTDTTTADYSLGLSVAVCVPKEVATWKRNFFRGCLAVVICLMAVGLRNVFAYVGALAGALGSSPLSFILPCLFHMRIQKQHLSKKQIALDIIIMCFGFACSVVGVTVTFREMIKLL